MLDKILMPSVSVLRALCAVFYFILLKSFYIFPNNFSDKVYILLILARFVHQNSVMQLPETFMLCSCMCMYI